MSSLKGRLDSTLAKGLGVIEWLARQPGESRVTDVARALGLARSNAHRTLQTLVACGWAVQNPASSAYRPSLRLFELGSQLGASADQVNVYLRLWPLFFLLCVAAILGDTVNYAIGARIGPKVFHYPKSRFFNPDHLKKTHEFYEKYGGKTIIIARFVPIVRTFAPFVAGVGQMSYRQFIGYNVIGGVLWVSICVFAGYFFGNLPFVKKNFSVVVIVIVLISLLPAVIVKR